MGRAPSSAESTPMGLVEVGQSDKAEKRVGPPRRADTAVEVQPDESVVMEPRPADPDAAAEPSPGRAVGMVRAKRSGLRRETRALGPTPGSTHAGKAAYHASLVASTDYFRSDIGYSIHVYRASVRQALSNEIPVRRASAVRVIQEEVEMLLSMRAMRPVKRENITAYEWINRVCPARMFLKDECLWLEGDYVNPAVVRETGSPTMNPMIFMTMIDIAVVESMDTSCHDIKGTLLVSETDRREDAMYSGWIQR